MRISTRVLFETGTNQLGTLQSQLAKTQMQLATNRRILTPSDDPIASARALEITQSQAVNAQYAVNRSNARDSLSHVEMALANASGLLQDVKAMTVSAGNAALQQSDREALATELAGRLEDLMAIANSSDGMGNYLFSGYRSTTQPFTKTSGGVVSYGGDYGQRELQVGSARKLETTESGASVFLDIPTGNGKFSTSAVAANTGTGVISQGTVSNPAALSNDTFELEFDTTDPANPTYTVTNTSTGAVLASAQAYKAGDPITVSGMTFDVKGAPADGDRFTIEPAKRQSMFETIGNLINVLRTPTPSATDREKATAELSKIGQNLSNALDNVLTSRASVGARMKELDYLDSAGEDLDIQYAARKSELEDLDMVKAISQFSQQQFALEAAQKSFKTLTGLSLFNYIG
ncbi:flagellar hook-associated protein FlgL [Pseudoduganella sp. GCM10020061]|uniref:flagellar hook-associated protein FlgL n=1 Tax=Pseudoduganella sp. GCM10020061 TaxID=3317345 RepID=UPI003637168D